MTGRRIRPPEAFGDSPDDGRELVLCAICIGSLVARHTAQDAHHVTECVMRVVGHLCEMGKED